MAVIISILLGLTMLSVFSFLLFKRENHQNPIKAVLEHLVIALIVIFLTHYLGKWITFVFN
jgi:VIT1/CCC1 family predicted Fe2+/Mn2+ transporter